MHVVLDACVIIYLVEHVQPFAKRAAEIIAGLRAGSTEVVLATSDISRLECRVRPLRGDDQDLLNQYRLFFSAPGFVLVELSAPVIDLATAVRAESRLRTPDALQAASCLALPAPRRFVTADAAFRRVPGLDVVLV